MHKPDISPVKRSEMEHLQDQTVHSKIKSHSIVRKRPKYGVASVLYDETMHNFDSDSRVPSPGARAGSATAPELHLKKKKRKGGAPAWKKKNQMIPEPTQKREAVIDDYLAKKRQRRDKNDNGATQGAWKKGLNEDLEGKEKIEQIKENTRHLEQTAYRKEQFMKVKGSNIEETCEINNMLIDAIEGKLAILDEI